MFENTKLHLFNGFDKLKHTVNLRSFIQNGRFAQFDLYVNDGIIANNHLNNLPFGNYDFEITYNDEFAVENIFSRGQSYLHGSNEIINVEYISDNEKSESIIYVS